MKPGAKVIYKNRKDKSVIYTIHNITEDNMLAGVFKEGSDILVPVKVKNLKLVK